MKKKLRVLELFAGIGAPRKALIRGGYNFEIIDAIEIDKYAVKSYNAMYNDNIEVKDICEYYPKKEDIGEIDLLFHGSPCTSFSLAGKQEGGDKGSGTPSSLMYETIRIVEELRPKYVIWENVKNLLSKKHRHNFDAYLETMEKLGYSNFYQVLNAKDYGIPQNRERVFTVSILNNNVVGAAMRGRYNNGKIEQHLEISDREYANAITTVQKDSLVCEKYKQFVFPPKQELKLKLKDMLEDADDKYYIKNYNKCLSETLKDNDINNEIAYIDGYNRKVKENNLSGTITTRINASNNTFLAIKKDIIVDNKIIPSVRANFEREKEQILHSDKDVYKCQCSSGWCDNQIGLKISPTLRANNNKTFGLTSDLLIRKLTPKECWRLMGFDDEDFEKAKAVNSDTQLYKQAGNSIVVNVIEAIYDNLLVDYEED